ncbi:MAG: hypothetical protein KF865_04910 [Bdellovibrionaceae bacterium]|nr:hypothetical protein [Pseudobdellovibrionaceae bacterium]
MKRLFCFLVAMGTIHPVLAQDMPFLGDEGGNPFVFVLESLHAAPAEATGGPKTAMSEQKMLMSLPLVTGEETSWKAVLKGQRMTLDEDLVIADRNFTLPRDLGSAELGLGWQRRSSPQRRLSVVGALGSTGRSLLSNRNAVEVSFNVLSENKVDDEGTWIYFLNYSNNRTLLNNVPLPGFAYVLKRDSTVYVMGVPFIFFFKHSGRWLMNAALSPFFVGSEVTYIWGWPQFFAGLGWMPRSYQNLVTDDAEDRLFYEKKEGTLGLRLPFGKQKSASLAYVHNFDRKFYLGESTGKIHSDVLTLKNAGSLQFKMKYTF